jgi:hypothetical protein
LRAASSVSRKIRQISRLTRRCGWVMISAITTTHRAIGGAYAE